MKYTIQSIASRRFEDKQTKQQLVLLGYSFMDECNRCIAIAYGDSGKSRLIECLEG